MKKFCSPLIRISAILMIALSAGLSSCNRANSESEIKGLMGEWYKKKIVFPGELELLNKSATDRAYWNKINTAKPGYYIVHFFMADCDKCVNELTDIQKFIRNRKKDQNVQFIFIASGPTHIYAEQAIKSVGFDLPVYYEKKYFSFKSANQLPLADKLYNTMLMNHKQEVILFGEIFQNKEAENLFYSIINSFES